MKTGKKDMRLAALVRFATAITAFNLIGHLWLGFEQAWAHPLVALAAAYGVEVLLESIEAWTQKREARFVGGPISMVQFLLPAHITGMAVSMLLYANSTLAPVAFASAVAIASKYIFRATASGRARHFLNPSNFGISVTLLVFPWVGIAMPYMFTENLSGKANWVLPAIIIVSGSFLNTVYTRKIPLIASWLGAFALQGWIRSSIFDTSLTAALLPMTGVAFILFTFYMVSDPSTTPRSVRGQVLFGTSVAAVYSLLLAGHVVFTLFFALSLVCFIRGGALFFAAWLAERRPASVLGGEPDAVLGHSLTTSLSATAMIDSDR